MLQRKKVSITGVGIVSALGSDLLEVKKNLEMQSIPMSAIQNKKYPNVTVAALKNLDYQKYLGEKGLRFFDRNALMMGVALKKAMDEVKVFEKYRPEELGLALGADTATHMQYEYAKSVVTDPILEPNPQMIPNMSPNAIAGQLAIKFNLHGENITISNSEYSFWEAYQYANAKVELGLAKVFLVVSGEAISDMIVRQVSHLSKHQPMKISELAVCLVLESHEPAQVEYPLREIESLIENIQSLAGNTFGFRKAL